MYDLVKEKQEAIDAGERALSSLKQAQRELNSAKNWGIYDILAGGFISTMIKHSKMDQAKEYMEQARYDLRSFSQELKDVDIICNHHLETNDFVSFADWFFDGFFVDWMMRDRINNSRKQIDEAIHRVEDILYRLKRL